MDLIRKTIDAALSFVVKILGICLLITVSLQVFSRYTSFNLVWTDEVARLIFVWFAMLSIAVAYIENKHLTLDLVYDKLKPGVQRALTLVSNVLTLAVACLIAYTGFSLLKTVRIQQSPITQLSMAWFYAAVPVGFTFISVFGVFRVIESLRNLLHPVSKEKKEEDHPYGG